MEATNVSIHCQSLHTQLGIVKEKNEIGRASEQKNEQTTIEGKK